jgi:branched-chain amino acid transport system substrate-binding protein
MVSDYAPGIDAETSFKDTFLKNGGEIVEYMRPPLANPDFAPFLQRARDDKPDAIFIFLPSGQGAVFIKQFIERGLDKARIKVIGSGDVTDDQILNSVGDQVIGTVTAHMYSAYHQSALNKEYVAAIAKANNGIRANFISVGGYDGMHQYVISDAVKPRPGRDPHHHAVSPLTRCREFESPRYHPRVRHQQTVAAL